MLTPAAHVTYNRWYVRITHASGSGVIILIACVSGCKDVKKEEAEMRGRTFYASFIDMWGHMWGHMWGQMWEHLTKAQKCDIVGKRVRWQCATIKTTLPRPSRINTNTYIYFHCIACMVVCHCCRRVSAVHLFISLSSVIKTWRVNDPRRRREETTLCNNSTDTVHTRVVLWRVLLFAETN